MRRAAVIAALILASCNANSQTTEPPAPEVAETTTSTLAQTTTTEQSSEEANADGPEADATTTTTTTTTTTLPSDAAPDFAISQIVFGEDAFVVVTNWGNASGSLDGYWFSQAAAVQALPDIELEPSQQAILGIGDAPPPDLTGVAAIVHLGPSVGFVAPESGELALHRSDQFDDPASLAGYVSWGTGPHLRSDLAVAAGLWDGEPIPVFDDAPSISTGLFPATSHLDWSIDIGG